MAQAPSLVGGRQRDLFPLPALSRHDFVSLEAAGRSAPKSFAHLHRPRQLANEAIVSLNQLSGRGYKSGPSSWPSTSITTALNIGRKFLNLDCDFAGADADGALNDLLCSSGVYSDGRADVLPYHKDAVSWPGSGTSPIPVEECMGPDDRIWWRDWASHMLRDPRDSAEVRKRLGLHKAHCDPVLFSSSHKYGDFLRELAARGMVKFRPAGEEKGKL